MCGCFIKYKDTKGNILKGKCMNINQLYFFEKNIQMRGEI